jgi:hypothetical protein
MVVILFPCQYRVHLLIFMVIACQGGQVNQSSVIGGLGTDGGVHAARSRDVSDDGGVD